MRFFFRFCFERNNKIDPAINQRGTGGARKFHVSTQRCDFEMKIEFDSLKIRNESSLFRKNKVPMKYLNDANDMRECDTRLLIASR